MTPRALKPIVQRLLTLNSRRGAVLGDPATAYYRGAKTVGFGVVKPTTINQDPSETRGIIDISWTDWGESTATGRGSECSPTGNCRPVTVKVSHLGRCGGRTAYEDAAVAEAGTSRYDETIIMECHWPG